MKKITHLARVKNPSAYDLRMAEYRRKNAKRIKLYHAKWRNKNRARLNASSKRWYYINRWRKFKRLLSKTCGLCKRRKAKVIDHDHKTGKIRDGLCVQCNLGLGYFFDSPAILLQAIAYLKRHSKNIS